MHNKKSNRRQQTPQQHIQRQGHHSRIKQLKKMQKTLDFIDDLTAQVAALKQSAILMSHDEIHAAFEEIEFLRDVQFLTSKASPWNRLFHWIFVGRYQRAVFQMVGKNVFQEARDREEKVRDSLRKTAHYGEIMELLSSYKISLSHAQQHLQHMSSQLPFPAEEMHVLHSVFSRFSSPSPK